jgi:hypothetical protein
MVRQTSIEAYRRIEAEGLLSRKRWEVYSALFEYGPATGMELLERMNRRSKVDSQVRARLNELREMGLAREVGRRVCSVTNQTVILWDVTDAMPHPVRKVHEVPCPVCSGRGTIREPMQKELFT